MVPTDQGFGAGGRRVADRDDGLVEDLELTVGLGMAKIGDHAEVPQGFVLHVGTSQLEAPFPVLLGEVHRQVRVAEQVLGRGSRRLRDRDADADAHRHLGARRHGTAT